MTNEQLDAIRERCEAATAGPWDWYCNSRSIQINDCYDHKLVVNTNHLNGADLSRKCIDFTFIAAARTDIPALLDHIAEVEAENKRLREALREAGQHVDTVTQLLSDGQYAEVTRELHTCVTSINAALTQETTPCAE